MSASQRGSPHARRLVFGLLALVALLGLALFLLWSDATPAAVATASVPASSPTERRVAEPDSELRDPALAAPVTAESGRPTQVRPPPDSAATLLVARLAVAQGQTLPPSWGIEVRAAPGSSPALAAQELPLVPAEPGAAEIERELAPGTWRIRARAAGLVGEWRDVEITVHGPRRVAVELPLATCGWVMGQVRGEDGLPVIGIAVAVIDPSGEMLGETSTDGAGSFQVDCVRLGPARVVVGPLRRPLLEHLPVTVEAPGVMLDAFVVPSLREVAVLVIDSLGLPVAGVEVRVSSQTHEETAAITGPDGRAIVQNLASGEWSIHVSHPTQGSGNSVFVLGPQGPAEITVALQSTEDVPVPEESREEHRDSR